MRLVEGRAAVDDVDAFVERLSAIGDAHDAVVQAFDARYVAGREHLEAAARSARRAIAHDDAIADDPAVELLLYAAGRRQIDRALTIGVEAGEGPVVVAVDGGDEVGAAEAVETLLEPASTLGAARDEAAIREYYGVTDAELGATDATLEDLVVERVALLAVEK
ncbi:MAG: KEOPS complex subunit Cgi121 [Halobacteriales archaeon]|nr:KEOPS complex subunit Cgi121 [Halobacteriales archaeon]